jgi:hypothetical protein
LSSSATISNQSSTSAASTVSATPSICGEVGNFILNVSDRTAISVKSN